MLHPHQKVVNSSHAWYMWTCVPTPRSSIDHVGVDHSTHKILLRPCGESQLWLLSREVVRSRIVGTVVRYSILFRRNQIAFNARLHNRIYRCHEWIPSSLLIWPNTSWITGPSASSRAHAFLQKHRSRRIGTTKRNVYWICLSKRDQQSLDRQWKKREDPFILCCNYCEVGHSHCRYGD